MSDIPIWMRPTQYVDDRFQDQPEPDKATPPPKAGRPQAKDTDAQRAAFKESLREFRSNDAEPLDYSRGPRDEEFGVDDDDYGPEPIDEVDEDGGEVS